jgi:uncharacterized coiled-coil DUF342 family protein
MSVSGETPDHVHVDQADELRADIANTRAELADTLDRLAAKADVKSRVRRQVHELVDRAKPYRKQLATAGAGLLLLVTLVAVRRG